MPDKEMTDAQRIQRLAENVMGWQYFGMFRDPGGYQAFWITHSEPPSIPVHAWNPLQNDTDAEMVLICLLQQGWVREDYNGVIIFTAPDGRLVQQPSTEHNSQIVNALLTAVIQR